MLAGGDAGPGAGPTARLDPGRTASLGLLLLLGLYVLAVAEASRRLGVGFDALQPWPLGGPETPGLAAARAVSLLLGLCLGWAVPGLPLALATRPRPRGLPLLARSLGLGVGFLLLVGLGHAAVVGHFPGRRGWVLLLALGSLAPWLRRPAGSGGRRSSILLAAIVACVALLTALLWPLLAWQSQNGDGTEAYELARSLDAHPLPYWDLERPGGGGRFGDPAVNPVITYAAVSQATMSLLGPGELGARLPVVPALVLCGLLAAALAGKTGRSAWLYAALLVAVQTLWGAYYVGYEPAFSDLGAPLLPETFTTVLVLAGLTEAVSGSRLLAAGILILPCGVLYSAPILIAPALAVLAWPRDAPARRTLLVWLAGLTLALALALVLGARARELAEWARELRSEYWADFVDPLRARANGPFLLRLLLATGALPLVAALRPRRLTRSAIAPAAGAGVYLLLVLVGRYKNLHYLEPVPFLLAPAALAASGPRLRTLGILVLAAALLLSWPAPRPLHREPVDLGRITCVEGLGYEQAALAGDVVYHAFGRPGDASRFAIGKHTLLRYALDLSGPCVFRVSPNPRAGWITVAGDRVRFSVRDLDRYVAWRFRTAALPSSALFPRLEPPALPARARSWTGRIALGRPPGEALVLDGFGPDPGEQRVPGSAVVLGPGRGRLLVPAGSASVTLRTWAPAGGRRLRISVNGERGPDLALAPGWSTTPLPTGLAPWRRGWNLLEIAPVAPPRPALQWLEVGR